jgi:hypothetical protein
MGGSAGEQYVEDTIDDQPDSDVDWFAASVSEILLS